jgi:hypothetical protein
VPTLSLDIDFTSHACHDVIYCCNGCVEAFFNAAFVCSLIQWYLDFGDLSTSNSRSRCATRAEYLNRKTCILHIRDLSFL